MKTYSIAASNGSFEIVYGDSGFLQEVRFGEESLWGASNRVMLLAIIPGEDKDVIEIFSNYQLNGKKPFTVVETETLPTFDTLWTTYTLAHEENELRGNKDQALKNWNKIKPAYWPLVMRANAEYKRQRQRLTLQKKLASVMNVKTFLNNWRGYLDY